MGRQNSIMGVSWNELSGIERQVYQILRPARYGDSMGHFLSGEARHFEAFDSNTIEV